MITNARISELLPHRYPLLLVDQVREIVTGEWISTIKAITCNEPWYADAGSSPGEDLSYPRALLIESFVQSAALLAVLSQPDPGALRDKLMLFSGMTGVAFRRSVVPGEVVEHRVRLVRSLLDTMIFEGESEVDGESVCTVSQVVLAFRPGEAVQTVQTAQTATANDLTRSEV